MDKRKQRRKYKPRVIDRVVFGVLATLQTFSGFYLAGPWYLDTWDEVGKAPLANLFNSDEAVAAYGIVMFINGLMLFYAAAGRAASRFYTTNVSFALLSGFLVRLYSLFGTLIILESWRPPTYLSQVATVLILGVYWVWVKVQVRNVRTIQ